ncbi:MAG: hypothetical protein AAF737_02510 [Pseudomonadota bacterium]
MQVFDPIAFGQLTADDLGLQSELLQILRGERSTIAAEAAQEQPAVFSHKLRGLAANLCALQLTQMAHDWTAVPDQSKLLELEVALDALEHAIAEHLARDS